MSGKGFKFVGKTKQVEKAPEAFINLPATEGTDIKPSKMTTALKKTIEKPAIEGMFARKPVVAIKQKAPILPVIQKLSILKAPIEETVEPPTEAPIEETVEPPPLVKKKKFKVKKPAEYGSFEDPNLDEMARLIREEESKDPYEATPVKAFVPETRRGFSEFIKETYKGFTLEPTEKALPTEAGEKYPYQKFIREYMRQSSPYRGILTYHGLGSGKTCTAIAASEALFSTANKKIIVMTPASLRKNFLKEVSLCGFRHFRLQNYWEALPIDQTTRLFATSVLGLSESYLRTASSIWIPDFRKTPEEANYSTLSSEERTEIRKQILSLLVWDAEKNPTGRIRFINYNGIPAKKLQAIACKTPHNDFFDDAVIIIDEIHNIVRLMQGTIDPYLIKMKALRRLIPMEEITVDKWKPSLCREGLKTYARGYLFYRLLLDARNSKIIGLSGTPLINFPEELGILMNVLHGYIPTIELIVSKVGSTVQKQITDLMTAYKYVDFVKVSQDPSGGGTRLVCSLLPYGIRKISNDIGVERIPQEETIPTIDIIVNEIQQILEANEFVIRGSINTKAQALLPPFADSFNDAFIGQGTNKLKNDIVLVKRLTGLVSYYKGSRADLMPSVKVDEVVRVPMSLYSQKKYVEARETEVASEKSKTKQTGMSGVWAEVYEVGGSAPSSNYKMASRQACNFTFPPNVLRPKPKTKKEQMAEAARGDKPGDIVDAIESAEVIEEDMPELDEYDAQEEADIAATAEEDALKEEELKGINEVVGEVDAPVPAPVPAPAPADTGAVQAGGDGDNDTTEGTLKPLAILPTTTLEALAPPLTVETQEAAPQATTKKFALKGLMQKKAADLQATCKSGKEGDTYQEAIIKAKECLVTIGRDSLKLIPGATTGLQECSPKFAEMLTRIAAAPGSSLVYSQFLDMEGIGIFRMCMDVNGYAPIEIISSPAGLSFSKATEASFRNGNQPRYISFTGEQKDDDVRRLALDIFNAKLDELPSLIKNIITESGYTNNHKGEICRVFCITSAGAEGLSLKNVRAVHIMDPYWNDVRLRQVKGRAIRIGSHLELPEADRNVSIYTYLSCFSKDAQVLKAGEGRIDETIRVADRVERKEAVALKLPIPERATEYIVTTDERIFLIAERKKGVLNSLESAMKSAAIDCELNIEQNRDGSFQCMPLKGKVGDFLYDPDLDIDIRESASKYKIEEKPALKPNFILKKFKGVVYRMKIVDSGFEMYAEDDIEMKRILGTAGMKEGQPAPPVKFN